MYVAPATDGSGELSLFPKGTSSHSPPKEQKSSPGAKPKEVRQDSLGERFRRNQHPNSAANKVAKRLRQSQVEMTTQMLGEPAIDGVLDFPPFSSAVL